MDIYLMSTNCYDVGKTMIVVGSCLKRMQPLAYKELEKISDTMYNVCLEATHINMVITKIIGMISRVKMDKIVFVTVDESPHCIQLHYIEHEIRKAMNIDDLKMVHYVAVENNLIQISSDTIKKSKSLSRLEAEKI